LVNSATIPTADGKLVRSDRYLILLSVQVV
jgi:hypothetical protein